MMLYLDTSALVKLYVDEPMSRDLAIAVDEAEAIATSLLAYAEARAAFARARREARLSAHAYFLLPTSPCHSSAGPPL